MWQRQMDGWSPGEVELRRELQAAYDEHGIQIGESALAKAADKVRKGRGRKIFALGEAIKVLRDVSATSTKPWAYPPEDVVFPVCEDFGSVIIEAPALVEMTLAKVFAGTTLDPDVEPISHEAWIQVRGEDDETSQLMLGSLVIAGPFVEALADISVNCRATYPVIVRLGLDIEVVGRSKTDTRLVLAVPLNLIST